MTPKCPHHCKVPPHHEWRCHGNRTMVSFLLTVFFYTLAPSKSPVTGERQKQKWLDSQDLVILTSLSLTRDCQQLLDCYHRPSSHCIILLN